MAKYDRNENNRSNFVDISSNKQIQKVYIKKGRTKRIICLVLSIFLLLGGSGLLHYFSLLNSLNYKDLSDYVNNNSTNETFPDLVGDKSQLSLSGGELLQDSKVLNVMLFGEDNAHGEEHGRSDTMIMMSIDNRHKKLKLTSFQRDTYVYIPEYGYNRMNASYTLGGAGLTIKTIESNFGIKVDRYAVVDFNSFIKIIDTLGGIDLELTQDEIDYINYQLYKNKQSDTPTDITDSPGIVHITGQQALWYARNRGLDIREEAIGIDGDDWDRTSRQRKLIQKLFTDMKSADLTKIVSIVSSVGPLVTTNLKKDEITALVSHSLTYLKYDVEQYNIPSEGMWYYDDKTLINSRETSTIKIYDLNEQRIAFAEFIYEELISGSSNTAE